MSTKTTGWDACPDVHELFRDLPSFTDPGEAQRRLGFSDGLYVFYEDGEPSVHGPGGRVVRVGNHPRSDGTLSGRLRQHYSGRKNGSVRGVLGEAAQAVPKGQVAQAAVVGVEGRRGAGSEGMAEQRERGSLRGSQPPGVVIADGAAS